MERIKIELTVDEANLILAALGQQPYLKVVDLIQKIQGQGAAQLNASSEPADATAELIHADILAGESNGN